MRGIGALIITLALSRGLAAQPLFDTHLHYSADDAAAFTPAQILATLDRNDIAHAVVTGTPAAHTEALFRYAPARIVPFLGVYRSDADKIRWPHDAELPARVEQALTDGIWRGIGELHIFAADRDSAVFRRLVELAAARDLPLLMHADPEVIDTLFAIAPQATVLWAHAGTEPRPALLADYLARYPRLYVDLSVRDERIAPDGKLAGDWRALFLAHPDRFLVGVDTFSVNRWRTFDALAARIRAWLAQLPPEIAEKLARGNATALFKPMPQYLCH